MCPFLITLRTVYFFFVLPTLPTDDLIIEYVSLVNTLFIQLQIVCCMVLCYAQQMLHTNHLPDVRDELQGAGQKKISQKYSFHHVHSSIACIEYEYGAHTRNV